MGTVRFNEFPDFLNASKNLQDLMKRDIPQYIGNTAVNFFKDSFMRKGWLDVGFKQWKAKADGKQSNLIKSPGGGDLKRSIKLAESTQTMVRVTSDTAYSQIHNEGGVVNIPVTAQSRKYFWAMFKKTENAKYKAMALTKKTAFKVTIEKRQYMGNSTALNTKIDFYLKRTINNLIK